MTTTKARTATVTIAGQEVQCLMLPSGEFRIAVTQVWSLLQLSAIPTNATKDVKALLGGEVRYSITEKVSSDINSQAVNTITLDAFGLVLVAVDDYTTAELATLNLAEQMYDRLRTKGMTHTEALALV